MEKRLIPQPDGTFALGYPLAGDVAIDQRLADAFTAVQAPVLLPGTLMRYPDGTLEIQCPLSGETLESRLARPFTGPEACALMESMAMLIDNLVANMMPFMNVRLSTDEVVMDGDTGGCRFVFLPVSGLRPDLNAASSFFRGIGMRIRPADSAAISVLSSYSAFFKKPGPFDVMGFSTHLKQAVAAITLVVTSTGEPALREASAARAAGDDSATTVLGIEDANDEGTTVLVEDEPNDEGTTVLGLDENADYGTTVLTENELAPDVTEVTIPAPKPTSQTLPIEFGDLADAFYAEGGDAEEAAPEVTAEAEPEQSELEAEPASESEDGELNVAQSRPDRTGVLNPIDFQVAEGYEDLFAPDVLEAAKAAQNAPSPVVEDEAEVDDGFTEEIEPEAEPEPESEPAPEPVKEPDPVEPVAKPAAPSAPVAAPEPVPAPATPQRFFLTRLSTGERFEVKGRRFVVGKSKHSSFQVKGTTTVSRSHAIFVTTPTACTIEDDNSRNGTFINNQEIYAGEPAELVDGDTIRLSDENFAFEIQPA